MKNFVMSFVLVFAVVGTVESQSLRNFFDESTRQVISEMVYPTATYSSSSIISSDHQTVRVRVNYTEGWWAILDIRHNGRIFDHIRVVDYSGFLGWPPFASLEIIKDLTMDFINSGSEEQSQFERELNKRLYQMDGREMACLVLTLRWWNY